MLGVKLSKIQSVGAANAWCSASRWWSSDAGLTEGKQLQEQADAAVAALGEELRASRQRVHR